MAEYRNGSHTAYDIKYYFAWITKYRYKVLKGAIAVKLRDLLEQGCETKGIQIAKRCIAADHVHMLLSCPCGSCTEPDNVVPKRAFISPDAR